jgi:predicted Ser/Thr protein kinase
MSALLAATLPAAAPAGGGVASEGQRIGRYQVCEVLGEGAMGIVYKAHDPLLARAVALKTIRKCVLGSAEIGAGAALRLRNEAQAAARLSHPGIVSVYEYGEDGEQSFIAMEYVHGTPLLTGMARPDALPVADVLCLMVQLLAALQCAHEQGVVHRDIKPANLMITPAGRVKIADFGIARIDAVALTADAAVMGSPGYMAPECYRGAAVDARTDLYACGVLLYELLVGARPFRGGPEIVMYKTLHLPVPALVRDEVPASAALAPFEPVLQRALAKSPDDRYASALEMREALTRAAQRPIANTLSPQAMALLVPGWQATAPASGPSSRPALSPALNPALGPTSAPRGARAAPTFAPALLERVIADLAREVGPIARCIVERACERSDSEAALLLRAANEALPAPQRQAFIERHRGADRPGAASAPPPGVEPPVLGHTALEPALVAAAQALVLRHLGPIAPWMVRRAAANASTREHFIARLADMAAEGGDRERLLAALCRLR